MNMVRKGLESALSLATVLATLAAITYVLLGRWAGTMPPAKAGGLIATVFDLHLHAFVLGPLWFGLCVHRSILERQAAALIRHRSWLSWWRRQCTSGAAESLQIVIAMLAVAAMVVLADGSAIERHGWLELSLRLVLYTLFLVASRATFAVVGLFRSGSLMLPAGAAAILFGVITATEMPVPDAVAALSWLTWADARAAADLTGAGYSGFLIFALWLITLTTLISRERWTGAWQVVVLLMLAGVALQALLIWGAAAVEPVTILEAFGVIYHGPMVDMVGVPLIPVFLALLLFFGTPVAMLKEFDNQSGAWLALVLIRAGSPMQWVLSFLGRWLAIAGVVLIVGPVSTVLAWAVLPDSTRGAGTAGPDAALGAFRLFAVGPAQVCFYLLLAFSVAWITARAVAGLVAVMLMMVGGIINPLFGGLLPVYLNGLARVEFGWFSAWHDLGLLLAANAVLALVLSLHIRSAAVMPYSTSRRMPWPRSSSIT